MSNVNQLSEYFHQKIPTEESLKKYLSLTSIVSIELDQELVYDFLVLIPDKVFDESFKTQFGENFVVNDQKHSPPVFTRFKNYQWLRNDMARRLPIALWIFKRAHVVQDPEGRFGEILGQYSAVFDRSIKDIIRRKYIEFRSDRHNLRQAVHHQDDLAVSLLKANVIKNALEILILFSGQPYPYKKWLAFEAKKIKGGVELLGTSRQFVGETSPVRIIALSDELVSQIVSLLKLDVSFSSSFLIEWWLHLS